MDSSPSWVRFRVCLSPRDIEGCPDEPGSRLFTHTAGEGMGLQTVNIAPGGTTLSTSPPTGRPWTTLPAMGEPTDRPTGRPARHGSPCPKGLGQLTDPPNRPTRDGSPCPTGRRIMIRSVIDWGGGVAKCGVGVGPGPKMEALPGPLPNACARCDPVRRPCPQRSPALRRGPGDSLPCPGLSGPPATVPLGS